ncbi:hypothetical protein MAJHIDBO_01236 [Propionibacterium freudenreichii subsp. shermanii]|nr:hypothetical protein MAJHIDBO_01236 [Propionibacterium freudenreichii subsp. shermanii]SPS09031.1 hypothetical protein MAJHIDBO_01236 [Propionibacterium freudenreichii subsp. shermanii]
MPAPCAGVPAISTRSLSSSTRSCTRSMSVRSAGPRGVGSSTAYHHSSAQVMSGSQRGNSAAVNRAASRLDAWRSNRAEYQARHMVSTAYTCWSMRVWLRVHCGQPAACWRTARRNSSRENSGSTVSAGSPTRSTERSRIDSQLSTFSSVSGSRCRVSPASERSPTCWPVRNPARPGSPTYSMSMRSPQPLNSSSTPAWMSRTVSSIARSGSTSVTTSRLTVAWLGLKSVSASPPPR